MAYSSGAKGLKDLMRKKGDDRVPLIETLTLAFWNNVWTYLMKFSLSPMLLRDWIMKSHSSLSYALSKSILTKQKSWAISSTYSTPSHRLMIASKMYLPLMKPFCSCLIQAFRLLEILKERALAKILYAKQSIVIGLQLLRSSSSPFLYMSFIILVLIEPGRALCSTDSSQTRRRGPTRDFLNTLKNLVGSPSNPRLLLFFRVSIAFPSSSVVN